MLNSLCAYSTANEPYVASAAAALLSVRKWNAKIPLFVVGKQFSNQSKNFLAEHKITPIEIDLSDSFYTFWGKYPVECYYLFAGPEIFAKKGFSHSLYIDGDVYCNQDPLIDLKKVKAIAGVATGQIKAILKKDFDIIEKHWPRSKSSQNRIQSGVLYFNNGELSKMNFLGKMAELFDQAIKLNVPRKGDDSLFALFQYIYPRVDYLALPREYNFIEKEAASQQNWQIKNDQLIKNAVFYHFTDKSPKPWLEEPKYPNITSKYFGDKWKDCATNSFSAREIKKYFPAISTRAGFFKWLKN